MWAVRLGRAPSDEMAARSPTRYGRYELVGPLATGGMADLHLARASGPSGFESLAVVKRIRAHLAANPDFVRLFLDEARLAAQLRHPNLVGVFDAGQEHGEYFFAMEFVHGRDARALIEAALARQRPLSFDEAISIVVGVCAGLHHAHERTGADGRPLGIVHRDISPSNILISFDGAVKLGDFGIAKATQLAKEPGTNTLRGKLSYMSPEQALGAPLDRRSDLYSLAVVLYELTTGGRPYPRAASEFLEVKQAIETPPRPPSQLRRDYPIELERIVLRALSRDREQRYATAREMQLELEELARRRQLAVSSVTLAGLMEELFADDIDAWQLAKRRGTSLAQHVTDSHTHSLRRAAPAMADTEPEAPRVPPEAVRTVLTPEAVDEPPPRRSRRALAVTAALSAAGIIAFVVTVWPRPPAEVPAAAVAPLAAPSTPAPPIHAAPIQAPPIHAAPIQAALTNAAPPHRAPPPSTTLAAAAGREQPPPERAPPPRVRLRAHPTRHEPSRHAAKRPPRTTTWDPEAPVLPH